MNLKATLKKLRDTYVIKQVQRAKLPEFAPDRIRRYRFIFSGRVQKVGFRLEVCELAESLGLTGFCQNLDNGDVLAELQGADNRIQHLVSFMGSLKRIRIKHQVVEELPIDTRETAFIQR